MSFDFLTPDAVINAVEGAMGVPFTGLTIALPSYINRVYELRAKDGTQCIAKFYRADRWNREAIREEHQFIMDCAEAELPVVAPLRLSSGETLGVCGDTLFAIFPKRAGRQLEINDDSYWPRIGSLIGRLHVCGEKRAAPHRVIIDPRNSALSDVEYLRAYVIPERFKGPYGDIANRFIERSAPVFKDAERIRIHGDCHRGNILDRLDVLLLIDFDDMAMGPPVQDLWLLLPDRASASRREIEMFLEGYERFRKFDRLSLACIEPLRAMRMIYFLAWLSRQSGDARFKVNFPGWGSDSFWQREINDLREQTGFIE